MDEKKKFLISQVIILFFVITEWCKRCCPSYTKKWMDQLIIDYDTRFDMWPQFIAFFHLYIYMIGFYHKLFPWAWMIPLSPHCCCCIHVYCDIHLWWLYNMLENYKLHHPSNASNDNTRTMQKQLSNKFQAGTAKSAFFCAHTKCKL